MVSGARENIIAGRESENGFNKLLFCTAPDEQHLLYFRSTFSKKIRFSDSMWLLFVSRFHIRHEPAQMRARRWKARGSVRVRSCRNLRRRRNGLRTLRRALHAARPMNQRMRLEPLMHQIWGYSWPPCWRRRMRSSRHFVDSSRRRWPIFPARRAAACR